MLTTHLAIVLSTLKAVVAVVVVVAFVFVTAFKIRVCRFVSSLVVFCLVNTALILVFFYDADAAH